MNEVLWEDPDEAEGIEPLNWGVFFCQWKQSPTLNGKGLFTPVEAASLPPVEAVLSPLSEEINPALPEETVTSPNAVAMKDNAESPQDPPPSPF